MRGSIVCAVALALLTTACGASVGGGAAAAPDARGTAGPETGGASAGSDAGLPPLSPARDAAASPARDATDATEVAPDAAGAATADGAVAPLDAAPARDVAADAVTGPRACSDLYDEALLPTFEIDVAPETWQKLRDLFVNHAQRKKEGIDLKQYLPATAFRLGSESAGPVEIRLKGNDEFSWAPAQQKMQFVVRFPKDRPFHGLRRLALDAPWYDPSLLRERMATRLARDLGLIASCANNARLVVNGAYYGLFVNLEVPDEKYLRRNFVEHDGNLWKNGRDLEEGMDDGDQRALNATFDVPTLRKIADLDQWVSEWALEALMPHGDGYWCCGHNWLTYHHPTRGWQWLVYDTDAAFGWGIRGPDVDPVTCAGFTNLIADPKHQKAVLADPEYLRKFRAALASHLAAFDVAALQARLDRWNGQVAAAADADPNKSTKGGARDPDVAKLRAFLAARREFLARWIAR